ncbi:fatty acid desaturase [Marinomonas sp. 2405UD68-3]|uniref:fatty acid desaturase n=1 Tax=Marinomonas sp. 2405UD68-3 TaxID=3391835 RepID=UPI0039C96958
MNKHNNPRDELYGLLPRILQPYITWLSGIPSTHEKKYFTQNSITVIAIGFISILVGFLFINVGIDTGGLYGVIGYFLGFCFVAGGMRRLDVWVIHQTLHNKVFSSVKGNKYLGEFLTTILLRTPYEKNRKGHLGHHRSPCDENDEDIVFLSSAGLFLEENKRKLYTNILLTVVSPRFHTKFLYNRLSANLKNDVPVLRRLMALVYLTSVIGLFTVFGHGLTILLYWFIPLIFGFQISNFLYTTTEHRWWLFENKKAAGREKRDLLSFARVCCSLPPQNNNWFV